MVSGVFEELVLVSVVGCKLKVGGLVPLNFKVCDAGGVVAVGRVDGVALEEGLVWQEVDAAVVRVADDLHRREDLLNPIPRRLICCDLHSALAEVIGVPLKDVELKCALQEEEEEEKKKQYYFIRNKKLQCFF